MDLTSADIGDTNSADTEVFLVAKVQQNQQPLHGKQPESRSGMVSRENLPSSVGEKTSLSGSVGKSARRSLMWGKSSQRATHSRNSPVSKMSSVAEKEVEHLPNTSDSKTGRTPPRTATGKVVSRTVGVGALKLNSIMKQDADVEQVMSIWTPSADFNPDSQTNRPGDLWPDS